LRVELVCFPVALLCGPVALLSPGHERVNEVGEGLLRYAIGVRNDVACSRSAVAELGCSVTVPSGKVSFFTRCASPLFFVSAAYLRRPLFLRTTVPR
jgi:hypothetical protein